MATDWDALTRAALQARDHAYAPYSSFPVGAAGLTDDGRIVTGCNVENASFGLTLCAECGVVSALHSSGGGTLVAVVCVDHRGQLLSPCGRCRQILIENATGSASILLATGEVPLASLLPYPFGAEDLS